MKRVQHTHILLLNEVKIDTFDVIASSCEVYLTHKSHIVIICATVTLVVY